MQPIVAIRRGPRLPSIALLTSPDASTAHGLLGCSALVSEMTATSRPLVVTQGDPEGIGPELILRVGAEGALRAGDVVFVDPDRLHRLADALPPWARAGLDAVLPLLAPRLQGLSQVEALRLGVDAVLEQPGRALVTAPIDKARCRDEGFAFPGHTEYLAARAGGCEVAMLMTGPTLKIVLATIHLPLREVADALREEDVVRAARLLAAGLRDHFGCARPRIAVLGLNPHAGERGMLGDEETRIIAPALERLRSIDPHASFHGPLPADTAIHQHARGDYDGVVAMYHDQGLAPFKVIHFHDGVNMTLGLPFVRTSPDHGTARDIAGRGIADASSLLHSIRIARGGAS